jgi:hypothetical protein
MAVKQLCVFLEEGVLFKWDCRWTSAGQSILKNGGPSAKGDACCLGCGQAPPVRPRFEIIK